jgi:hypothetical protein
VPFARVSVTDSIVLPRTKNGTLKPYVLEELASPSVYGQGLAAQIGETEFVNSNTTIPADVLTTGVGAKTGLPSSEYFELRDWDVGLLPP